MQEGNKENHVDHKSTGLRRAEGNRCMAHAKQAVAAAAREGRTPQLADLLTEPTWQAAMAQHMTGPSFTSLQTFLDGEWQRNVSVFPPQDAIFRCAGW